MTINNYTSFYEFTDSEIQWISENVKAYEYNDHIGEYILKYYLDLFKSIGDEEDDDLKMFMSIWSKITLDQTLEEYISAGRNRRHNLESLFSEIFLMIEEEEANRIIREKYRRG